MTDFCTLLTPQGWSIVQYNVEFQVNIEKYISIISDGCNNNRKMISSKLPQTCIGQPWFVFTTYAQARTYYILYGINFV